VRPKRRSARPFAAMIRPSPPTTRAALARAETRTAGSSACDRPPEGDARCRGLAAGATSRVPGSRMAPGSNHPDASTGNWPWPTCIGCADVRPSTRIWDPIASDPGRPWTMVRTLDPEPECCLAHRALATPFFAEPDSAPLGDSSPVSTACRVGLVAPPGWRLRFTRFGWTCGPGTRRLVASASTSTRTWLIRAPQRIRTWRRRRTGRPRRARRVRTVARPSPLRHRRSPAR